MPGADAGRVPASVSGGDLRELTVAANKIPGASQTRGKQATDGKSSRGATKSVRSECRVSRKRDNLNLTEMRQGLTKPRQGPWI